MSIPKNTLTCNSPSNRGQMVLDNSLLSIYQEPEADTHILFFKDNAIIEEQEVVVPGKGALCNRISEIFSKELDNLGIETHFIDRVNMREQRVYATDELNFSIKIYNNFPENLAQHYKIRPENGAPQGPIIEFMDQEGKYTISERTLCQLGILDKEDIETILQNAKRLNDFLRGFFLAIKINLDEMTVKFGQVGMGGFFQDKCICITNTISPDYFKLRDIETKQIFTPLSFFANKKYNMYQEIANRMGLHI